MTPENITVARTSLKTLTQSIVSRADGDPQLALLMSAIQNACKVVAHDIRRAGIADLYGLVEGGEENATGDQVKKLDVIANDIWVSSLANSGVCCVLVSEEEPEPIVLNPKDGKTGGKHLI